MASKYKKRGIFISSVTIFLVLIIASISIIQSENVYARGDPVYIVIEPNGDSFIRKATLDDLLEFLFNHNFKVTPEVGLVPDNRCSVRARRGIGEVDEESYSINRLSFWVSNLDRGKGFITMQKFRDRFSFRFDVDKVLQNDENTLKLEVSGKGNLNRNPIGINGAILIFDKENNLVDFSDRIFSVEDMEVNFVVGCGFFEEVFFLVTSLDVLGDSRSISAVRALLILHPEFIDWHNALRALLRPSFGYGP